MPVLPMVQKQHRCAALAFFRVCNAGCVRWDISAAKCVRALKW